LRILFYYYETGAYSRAWIYPHWDKELTQSGHSFTVINAYDRGQGLTRDDYDQYVVETVTREHQQEPVSMLLCSVRSDDMSAEAVRRISDLGIPTINVTWDDTFLAHRVKEIAPAFDLYWVADPLALETMRGYGANVMFLPSAANPNVFRPEDVDEDIDLSFCGQRYGSRIYYVEELFKRGIDVDMYGVGWKSEEQGGDPLRQRRGLGLSAGLRHVAGSLSHRHGRTWARSALKRRMQRKSTDPALNERISSRTNPPLPFPDMIRLFSRSKMTLGFNELGHTYLLKHPLSVIRTRDFEAIASGACHFILRMPEWAPYFEEDRDVLCYASAEELADKVRFYLDPARDSARAEIRRNARNRAVQDHTWTQRFESISHELGVKS
jgi:spore maturation protein CgeB